MVIRKRKMILFASNGLKAIMDPDNADWIVVACATHARPALIALGAHCHYFGYNFYTAMYGRSWEGFKMKLEAEQNFAKILKPNVMMVLVDAYDMIVNAPLSHMKAMYKRVAKPGQIVAQQDI